MSSDEPFDVSDPVLADVDVVVLSCWPKSLVAVMPYVGSIDGTCEMCDGDVWVGGRQQEVIAAIEGTGKQVSIVCIPCTAALQASRKKRGFDDVHKMVPLGGEATPAGSARMDQLAKWMGVELP